MPFLPQRYLSPVHAENFWHTGLDTHGDAVGVLIVINFTPKYAPRLWIMQCLSESCKLRHVRGIHRTPLEHSVATHRPDRRQWHTTGRDSNSVTYQPVDVFAAIAALKKRAARGCRHQAAGSSVSCCRTNINSCGECTPALLPAGAPLHPAGGGPHVPDGHAINTRMLTTFSLMNIRGLVPWTVSSKVPYIRDLLNKSSQLAFALTETWLSDHNPAELHIPQYSLYRQDHARLRSKRSKDRGGVALYIKDDQAIFSEVFFTYSNRVIEAIGLQLKSLNLLLVVLYRQPDDRERNCRSTSREFGHFLEELDENLVSQSPPAPDIVIMGDFNLPHGDWSGGESAQGATGDEGDMVRALNELTSSHFLVQQVECPTHKDGGMLDLIFQ